MVPNPQVITSSNYPSTVYSGNHALLYQAGGKKKKKGGRVIWYLIQTVDIM